MCGRCPDKKEHDNRYSIRGGQHPTGKGTWRQRKERDPDTTAWSFNQGTFDAHLNNVSWEVGDGNELTHPTIGGNES